MVFIVFLFSRLLGEKFACSPRRTSWPAPPPMWVTSCGPIWRSFRKMWNVTVPTSKMFRPTSPSHSHCRKQQQHSNPSSSLNKLNHNSNSSSNNSSTEPTHNWSQQHHLSSSNSSSHNSSSSSNSNNKSPHLAAMRLAGAGIPVTDPPQAQRWTRVVSTVTMLLQAWAPWGPITQQPMAMSFKTGAAWMATNLQRQPPRQTRGTSPSTWTSPQLHMPLPCLLLPPPVMLLPSVGCTNTQLSFREIPPLQVWPNWNLVGLLPCCLVRCFPERQSLCYPLPCLGQDTLLQPTLLVPLEVVLASQALAPSSCGSSSWNSWQTNIVSTSSHGPVTAGSSKWPTQMRLPDVGALEKTSQRWTMRSSPGDLGRLSNWFDC